jgi:hypothetical protein
MIKDIDSLVRFFHDQNIYVIGRIAVFEDPGLAKGRPDLAVYDKIKSTATQKVLWQDNHGLNWIDPASKEAWTYNVALAKDVLSHGFDEINFDYIRFPSDGKVNNMGFPVWDAPLADLGQVKKLKSDVIKEFFNSNTELNKEFNFTLDACADEQNKKCNISGIELIFNWENKKTEITASLDRIDNDLGYIEGNVAWINKDINRMRNIFTIEHFIKTEKHIN